jgi:hypothetical protein
MTGMTGHFLADEGPASSTSSRTGLYRYPPEGLYRYPPEGLYRYPPEGLYRTPLEGLEWGTRRPKKSDPEGLERGL